MMNKLKMLGLLGPMVLSLSNAVAWEDTLDVKCSRASAAGALSNTDLDDLLKGVSCIKDSQSINIQDLKLEDEDAESFDKLSKEISCVKVTPNGSVQKVKSSILLKAKLMAPEELSKTKLSKSSDYTIDFAGVVVSTGVSSKPESEATLKGRVKMFEVRKEGKTLINLMNLRDKLKLKVNENVTITGESGPRLENRRLVNFKHSKFSILGMYDTSSTSDQNLNLVIAPEKAGELPITIPLSCEVKVISQKN